jgi:hypothetical protein
MATSRATRILKALTVLALVLIVGTTPGAGKDKGSRPKKHPPEPPMKVYVVTSAQDGCEPNCPQWIAAQGQIVSSSLSRFKEALAQIDKHDVPVLIHSPGGLTEQAMAIGRLIHDKGLDVAVAKTTFTPCAPDDAACRKKAGKTPLRGLPDQSFSICTSACTFILAAGKRRFVRTPAFVGVHRGDMVLKKIKRLDRMMPYRARDGSIKYRKRTVSEKVVSQKRTDTPDWVFDKYEDYFDEMGIAEEIIALMTATPNNSLHWLTSNELRSTRMATHRMSGEQLVHGIAVPDDGWRDPEPSLTPTATAILLRALQADCLDRGLNCPLGVEGGLVSGTSTFGAPVTPVPADPASPSAPASECALTGGGCSWELTPAAPSIPSR